MPKPILFKKQKMTKTAQEIQDRIFRKMSVERKIKLWSDFFKLSKELSDGKTYYGPNGSKASPGKCR